MRKKDRESSSMKDAINSFLKASGLKDEFVEKKVLGNWESIVGKPIALRTEKLRIENKTLYITLNSAVMRDELFQQKSKIIQLINDEAGHEMINEVFLR
jgi:predicted nucleic acid-binding Zn ribbon protein